MVASVTLDLRRIKRYFPSMSWLTRINHDNMTEEQVTALFHAADVT